MIGGSGFYAFLADAVEHEVTTPYGDPSAPVAIGEVSGRSVAFLPRHGKHHEAPPHGINYRANAWALRSLGVRQVPVMAPSVLRTLPFGTAVLLLRHTRPVVIDLQPWPGRSDAVSLHAGRAAVEAATAGRAPLDAPSSSMRAPL